VIKEGILKKVFETGKLSEERCEDDEEGDWDLYDFAIKIAPAGQIFEYSEKAVKLISNFLESTKIEESRADMLKHNLMMMINQSGHQVITSSEFKSPPLTK